MFNNVLVGVDSHRGGRDAIALSKVLLARAGELTLATVYSGDARIWHRSETEHAVLERAHALELLEHAREQAGVAAQLRWRNSSSVGRGLHELCEVLGSDLLVVGSSRHGLLGRVLIGDDTRAALNGVPCAIAIAPAGYAEQPVTIREVGVGYNATAESEHALAVARKIAGEHDARLSAFEAVALPSYAFLGGPAPIDGAIDELVDSARGRIGSLGGVDAHAVYGHPAEELALFSASLDLLVVGSRDYGPVGRLVHGSTSHQLAHSARCPLLVLTRAARASETSIAHRAGGTAVTTC
ncbi:MAG: universal stress protein [Solirubrobacteraceae bacterium]|jgi:nucleotide-binding universal stress UspA family protein